MKDNFSRRLYMARTMRGLSMQELADRLHGQITKQAIGKYEKGDAVPRKKNLIALADALNVKLDFFDRRSSIGIEPSYRKLDTLPVKKQNEIIELTRDYVERYLEAEYLVGEELQFEDFNRYACNSLSDSEIAAENLRKHWNLGADPLHSIVEILEEKGIKVFQGLFDDGGFSGLSAWINGNHAIIVVNKADNIDRQRFTALHELGHLVLQFADHTTDDQIESFCNRFAGAMLMPREIARKELGDHRKNILLRELVIIKRQHGISPQAMMKRATELGIIKEYRSRLFFQKLKAQNLLKEEIGHFTGVEETSRLLQIICKGVAEDYITTSMGASLLNTTVTDFRRKLNYNHEQEARNN